ncbi:MAG: DNA polymerase III subunit gamma/tau [Bacillota bacterium]
MAYLALYREWRPKTFAETVGQEHVSRTLQNALRTGRIAHAYLFCGPRGTGKTTTAKLLAKALNCRTGHGRPVPEPCNECENCQRINQGNSMDVLEIDAASNRGIDEIRELREKVKFAPTEGYYKVYIIDEVHMLTNEAFNALLKTLEEPPGQVVFILATTEPHKIPLTILSRCQRFDFKRIPLEDIMARLREVAAGEGIKVTEEALLLIARAAEGGMRDALSLLDQARAMAGEQVEGDHIRAILGAVSGEKIARLLDQLIRRDLAGALQLVGELVEQGKDLRQFVRDLLEYLRDLLVIRVARDVDQVLRTSPQYWERLKAQAEALSPARVQQMINILTETEQGMRWSQQPRLLLELALIKGLSQEGSEVENNLQQQVAQLQAELERLKAAGPVTAGPAPRTTPVARPVTRGKKVELAASDPVLMKQVQEEWPRVLELLRKRMQVRAFVVEGEPLHCDGQTLSLVFPDEKSFHRDRLLQGTNLEILEAAVQKVLGRPLRVQALLTSEIAGSSNAAVEEENKPDLAPEELVKTVQETFGAAVPVEIKD